MPVCVIDASVGVKWFRNEPGPHAARELLARHVAGEIAIAVEAAARVRAQIGCTLYDAFSAGLAQLLDVPLYSADARAHGHLPGVRLIEGE